MSLWPNGVSHLRTIGQINRPKGLKGEVWVQAIPDYGHLFREGSRVLVQGLPLKVESAKPYGRRFLLKFEGICSLEQAEKLRGATLLVHEEDLPPLQEGEFFSSDLVGIRAFDTQGRYFGTVNRVMNPHNLDILVVQDEGRNEVLIPLLDTYVHKLSIEERLVVFDPACLP